MFYRNEREANVAAHNGAVEVPAQQRANPQPTWMKPSRCAHLRQSPRRRSWFGRFLYIYFGV